MLWLEGNQLIQLQLQLLSLKTLKNHFPMIMTGIGMVSIMLTGIGSGCAEAFKLDSLLPLITVEMILRQIVDGIHQEKLATTK